MLEIEFLHKPFPLQNISNMVIRRLGMDNCTRNYHFIHTVYYTQTVQNCLTPVVSEMVLKKSANFEFWSLSRVILT